jgi:hypothetical protein
MRMVHVTSQCASLGPAASPHRSRSDSSCSAGNLFPRILTWTMVFCTLFTSIVARRTSLPPSIRFLSDQIEVRREGKPASDVKGGATGHSFESKPSLAG